MSTSSKTQRGGWVRAEDLRAQLSRPDGHPHTVGYRPRTQSANTRYRRSDAIGGYRPSDAISRRRPGGGEGEIRTPETFKGSARFPSECIRPLCHLSIKGPRPARAPSGPHPVGCCRVTGLFFQSSWVTWPFWVAWPSWVAWRPSWLAVPSALAFLGGWPF